MFNVTNIYVSLEDLSGDVNTYIYILHMNSVN